MTARPPASGMQQDGKGGKQEILLSPRSTAEWSAPLFWGPLFDKRKAVYYNVILEKVKKYVLVLLLDRGGVKHSS